VQALLRTAGAGQPPQFKHGAGMVSALPQEPAMSPSLLIPSVAQTNANRPTPPLPARADADAMAERALASRVTLGVGLAAVLAGAVLLLLTSAASAPVPSALPVHAVLQADQPSFTGVDMRQVAWPEGDDTLPSGF
jgi:hypothetical protein